MTPDPLPPELLALERPKGESFGCAAFSPDGQRVMVAGSSHAATVWDVATGKKVWETPAGEAYRERRGNGPRGTPTVDGDRLYTLSADGTLLWVEGDPVARGKAEKMNFAPGADWSERGAGTNAPGTALALDREIQIRGSEHFSRIVQPWSCTAAPVHDPSSGALLGAIDLTGGASVASPQTLALVRAIATRHSGSAIAREALDAARKDRS